MLRSYAQQTAARISVRVRVNTSPPSSFKQARSYVSVTSSSWHISGPARIPPSWTPHLSRIGPDLPNSILRRTDVRLFHASQRNEFHPVLLVAGLLKSSSALGFIQILARVTLTFFPVFLIKKMKILRWLRRTLGREEHVDLRFPGKRDKMIERLRKLNHALLIMLMLPCTLFWLTVVASLERTPITGRWRLILLSPEEEEEIARQLTGTGWYSSVSDILTSQSRDQKTPPTIIPPTDWRWRWVEQTLRRLEAVLPIILDSEGYARTYETLLDNDYPLPPPPSHPLIPRPRAAQVLHSLPPTDNQFEPHSPSNPHTHHVSPHTLLGPPYSLLIVENPERNAFSFGFGADGGGGLVLYSGFLDEVLKKDSGLDDPNSSPLPPVTSLSFWAALFSGSNSSRTQPSQSPGPPTLEQTTALATLLAHELSHLVLSHHLETLSSGTILFPTVTGIVSDVFRAFLFPLTFLFGPFIGDALADIGKIGMGEVSKRSESCASHTLELEADLVSVRLLSLAGFDPRSAVEFWEGRLDDTEALDADIFHGRESQAGLQGTFWDPTAAGPGNASHPVHGERVKRIRRELERWEQERRQLVARRSQSDG